MNNKTQAFLETIPNDNSEWVAQQIIEQFTDSQFRELHSAFERLNKAIYKSWAKDMPFKELKNAVDLVKELSDVK